MKNFIFILILNLFLFSNIYAEDTVPDKDLKEKEVKVIYFKVNNVATSAIDVLKSIKNIEDELEVTQNYKTMQDEIEPYSKSISAMLKSDIYKHIEAKNPRELQKMQSEVAIYVKQLQKWQSILKDKVEIYTKSINIINEHAKLWKETYANAKKKSAPKEIMKNISLVLKDVSKARKNIKKRYDNILILSQKVTILISKLQDVDSSLKKSELLFKNKIFYQDKEPLFTMISNEKFAYFIYLKHIKEVFIEKNNEVIYYLSANSNTLISLIILLLLSGAFTFYFNKLYRERKLFINQESYNKKEFYFMLKPFSVFLMVAMILITFLFDNRPKSLVEMQLYIIAIPSMRIILTTVNKELHRYIYYFFILFILFSLNYNAFESELEYRLFMLCINIAFLIYMIHIFKNKIAFIIENNIIRKIASYSIAIGSFALFVSLIANLYGSSLLSSSIIRLVLYVFYASIIFTTIYIITKGYLIVGLRRRISTASLMLEKYSKNMESTSIFLIKIWMTLWWLLVVFKLIGAYPYVIEAREFILNISWEIGKTTVSIQSIFDFFVIGFFTWLFAKAIKIILEVEIFSRYKLPRGIPTAIITTLNYLIIIVGTVLALSSLGISSQQFTVVLGALGVGIGFGLRNIIANFVSGIILVFERPVQIGDTIEINKTFGDVQSIGARSSTIRTYDGSEVVIPNADFMSKDIVNWTYSEIDRRKDITFRVDIDNDVDTILNIMTEVALSHTDIICQAEELMPTLNSIGEYYLEFKLYFWLKGDVLRAKSRVNASLYKALREAGIKMPVQKFNRTV